MKLRRFLIPWICRPVGWMIISFLETSGAIYGTCPDSTAVRLLKHEIAYERTEESNPLQGLNVIHAEVWERDTLTFFYIREPLIGFANSVRAVYPVVDGEVRGSYTCPAELNWKACVGRDSDVQVSDQPAHFCTSTIDLRLIPAWQPSPNDANKLKLAGKLREEILAKWAEARSIVIRDFNLQDPQITMYLKMDDGDYIQGCGLSIRRVPHCDAWHSFGMALTAKIRGWIFQRPYRLK